MIQGFFVIEERKFFSHVESLSRAHGLAESFDNLLGEEGILRDISKRRQAEDALAQQIEAMSQLNQFSMELSTISVDENLEALITKWVKKITGATLATFNEYNYENRTITTHHIEVESGLREKIVRRLGKRVKKFHFVVSDEMYQQMITERIGKRSTLHEASLGTISHPIGAALQVLLKVDRFIGISYLIEGKLYGTSMLAMNVDQIDPPKNILERFISLATVSLRRKQAEEALRTSEERFRSLASSFNDIIYSLDTQQRHSGVYGNWVENIGLTPEFFLGKTSREIFGAEAALVHEEANQHALAGEHVTYEWSTPAVSGVSYYQTVVSPLRNSQGEIVGIVGVGRDITERRTIEEKIRLLNIELEKLALTDYLTSLYNQRYFMQRGAEELKRAIRNNQPLALMMLDIDEFKKINDTFGHETGDQALQQVAGIMKSSLREIDLLGRLGGDEFAVLLPDTSEEEAVVLAERVRQSIANTPFEISGQVLSKTISVSVGVAVISEAMSSIDDLLRNADGAMYRAKHSGRNCVVVDQGNPIVPPPPPRRG